MNHKARISVLLLVWGIVAVQSYVNYVEGKAQAVVAAVEKFMLMRF
jgi:hypothetical protein